MVQDAVPDRGQPRSGLWVGRQRESHVLDQMLDGLGAGVGGVIEVTGEPGTGKTRLLAELTVRAVKRRLQVLAGNASPATRHMPGGLLIDTLTDPAARRGSAGGEQITPGDLGLTDGLLGGELARDGSAHVPGNQAAHYRLYRKLRGRLEEIAATGLVLILDDLHWGDELSVELLAHLVRRPPQGPILLVYAYRQRQASVRLRSVAADEGLDPTPTTLQLGLLSERDAEELMGLLGNPAWRHAIYRESEGNPFYLNALIRTANWPDPAPTHAGDPAELPTAISATLLTELEALSPQAQEVARVAAVCDRSFCVASVMLAGRLEHDIALASLEEMAAQDIIRPAAGDSFVFRHRLVRAAIYHSANPVWRVAAHARVAAGLAELGARVAAAYHIERSATVGDLRAVVILESAAQAVWDRDLTTATGWLQTALRLLPNDTADKQTRARILLALAHARGSAGQLRACRDTAQEALRWLDRGDDERRAAAVRLSARAGRLLGSRLDGQALLRAEVAALPEAGASAVAPLWLELSASAVAGAEFADGRRWAEQALSVARRHSQRPIEGAAHGLLAIAQAALGNGNDAVSHVEDGARTLDTMLDSELAEHLDVAAWVGRGELLLDRPRDGLRHVDRACALAKDRTRHLMLPDLLVTRALLLRELGRLPEAAACANDAVAAALVSGGQEHYAAAMLSRCWVATWMGDLHLSDQVAVALPPWRTREEVVLSETRILAEARLAEGDVMGCLGLADGRPELPTVATWARAGWYEMLVRAELAVGRVDAAARWADHARASAANWNLPSHAGFAMLADAQVLMAMADPRSRRLAMTAHDLLSAADLVLDAIRARLVAATILAAQDSSEQAAAELAAVHSELTACGAGRLTRQVMASRRKLAAQARAPGDQRAEIYLAGLTHREQQVAAMASQGLSNRVISQRLHVSEKTIEKHLSNAFIKLGVSSRSQLTAIVVRGREASGSDWTPATGKPATGMTRGMLDSARPDPPCDPIRYADYSSRVNAPL